MSEYLIFPNIMKRLKFIFLLSLAWPCVQFLSAQSERPLPPPQAIAQTPWWAQQMYSGQGNVLAIDSAFTHWRQEHPTEDTYFTRYYKHWRKKVGSHLSPAGFWTPPSAEQEEEDARRWALQRAQTENGPSWSNIGPFKTHIEGSAILCSWQLNIYCLDQSISNPLVLYAGTENGAIFKSIDGAASWACVSNSLNLSGGIGAIKVDPGNPDIAFFGQGNNLYRSIDGGQTWNIVYTLSNLGVRDIAINPFNNQVILVAGSAGLFRSSNGGTTWSQLYTQGCWDIEIKTDDPSVYFLLKTNTSTKLCEFFKSGDYGFTWTEITNGWIDPSANSTADNNDGGGRLAVTNADPNRVYAVLLGTYNDGVNDNNYLGVYRSNDAGDTWFLPNGNNVNGGPGGPYAASPVDHACLVTFWFNNDQRYPSTYQYDQGFYNLGFDVSDTDPDRFLVGFLNLFKSEDGGYTFTRWGGYGGGPGWQHPDIQDIDINGNDLWVCSDGGLNKYSTDFSSHTAQNNGLDGSDFWGFDGGWNEDIVTGGRYHNGNTAAILGTYPAGEYIRLGGAESTTGYVHPGGGRRVMHSDINPDILPADVNGTTGSFSFTVYPNEGYAGNNENSSEIEQDPRCYNHLYIGSENKILKSTDGGISATTLYTFGSDASKIITGIEVSRSNPDVIYCLQNLGPAVLWKSTDGGQSFTQMPSPPGAQNGAFITLSPTDENTLWFAWNAGGSNGNKVFKSTNGGGGWTNLTNTSIMNGHQVEQIVHPGGTDDGLYLATNLGVFYHDGSNWQNCAAGLPARANINRMTPFYAKSKVRIATYGRGIWEADLAESFTPIVQPTVDKLSASCSRDTFYFDDYSIVNHTGATWAWSFDPMPQYVSNANIRNPKVVFGAIGTYTANLILNGSYSKTLSVEVGAGCEVQHYPGNAIVLDGTGDYATAQSNLALHANTVTLTAWIKRNGDQNDFAGIVFARGGTTTAGLSITNAASNHELRYHWNDNGWAFDSNLSVPDNTWTHVALVITPNNATMYMNGIPATHNSAQAVEAFDTPLKLGLDNGNRYFKGQIEEVTVWNAALSQDQIRALMHLTKEPVQHPNLVAYYQFNENNGVVLDKIASRHLTLLGDAARMSSTAPVGGGVSAKQTVNTSGQYTFGATGITMEFPGSGPWPNGDLHVSRLNLDPDQSPNGFPDGDVYWVVNNYGTNPVFNTLNAIRFDEYDDIPSGSNPAQFKLYKRGSFADGNTWGSYIDEGDVINTGTNGSVTFSSGNNIGSFSQFVVTNEAALPVNWLSFQAALADDARVRLFWTVQLGPGADQFIVEKSADGIHYQRIGDVNIVGQSGVQSYEWFDPNPHRGVNYYRLQQVDLDGAAQYSVVRTVVWQALPDYWSVYPNPVRAAEYLFIAAHDDQPYRFRLYNSNGKLVIEHAFDGGNQRVTMPTLPSGAYGYELVSDKRRHRGILILR